MMLCNSKCMSIYLHPILPRCIYSNVFSDVLLPLIRGRVSRKELQKKFFGKLPRKFANSILIHN